MGGGLVWGAGANGRTAHRCTPCSSIAFRPAGVAMRGAWGERGQPRRSLSLALSLPLFPPPALSIPGAWTYDRAACLCGVTIAKVEEADLVRHELRRVAFKAAGPPLVRAAAVRDACEQHPAAGPAELEDVLETRRGLVIRSDCKHQSAPHKHGHQIEHGTPRVMGGVWLGNPRERWSKIALKLPCRALDHVEIDVLMVKFGHDIGSQAPISIPTAPPSRARRTARKGWCRAGKCVRRGPK